jgi:hypothetical protein
MSKNTATDRTTSDKTLVDPIFQIPAGAEDVFEYSADSINYELLSVEDVTVEDGAADDSTTTTDGSSGDGVTNTKIGVPKNLKVVSQTLRRAPGGTIVVDVVIQIDTVSTATGYDVQVTKA